MATMLVKGWIISTELITAVRCVSDAVPKVGIFSSITGWVL